MNEHEENVNYEISHQEIYSRLTNANEEEMNQILENSTLPLVDPLFKKPYSLWMLHTGNFHTLEKLIDCGYNVNLPDHSNNTLVDYLNFEHKDACNALDGPSVEEKEENTRVLRKIDYRKSEEFLHKQTQELRQNKIEALS